MRGIFRVGMVSCVLLAVSVAFADTRPYEFRLCNRTDDLKPPDLTFEAGEAWQCVPGAGMAATFELSDAHQLFGKTTGRLICRAGQVVLTCAQGPDLSSRDFDFMSVWVRGDRWGQGANSLCVAPSPTLYADFRLRDGTCRRLSLGRVWWKDWFFVTRRLTEVERSGVVAFAGFCVSNIVADIPCDICFDNVAFWKDEPRPLAIAPRAKRPITPLPGANLGLNTGPGRLTFPTREETIIPPTAAPAEGDLLAAFNGGAVHPEEARHLRVSTRRVGKSLIVDFYAPRGTVREISEGEVTEAKVLRRIRVPYLRLNAGDTRLEVELLEGGWYRSAIFDWYRSNASRPSSHAGRLTMKYLPKTDGTYNDVSERLVITLSRNFADVLPVIPNPPSPWKHVTGTHLWRPHGATDRAHDAAFWRTMQRYGMTEVVVNDHETMWRDVGESYTYRTFFAEGKGGDAGQFAYTRLMRDELGYVYGPYNNFWDMAPVNRNFTLDEVTRLSDGSFMSSWMRTYAPKVAMAPAWSERLVPEIQRKMNFNSAYCDCMTSGDPWDRTDYDARVPGAGTFAASLYAIGELLTLQQRDWKGPVYSEGSARMFYAGLLDGNYADHRGFDFQKEPWIVDFDLLRIHPLECDFAAGTLSMFRRSPDTMEQRYYRPHLANDVDRDNLIDQYLAFTVAFGHAGFLIADWCFVPPRTFGEAYGPETPHRFDFAGGLPIAARSYFMIQAPAARYTQADVKEIWYVTDSGHLQETSQAIREGTVSRHQIAVRYADGTCVVANGSETLRLRTTFAGVTLDLPPRGYRVWNDAAALLAESSDAFGGNRADYCASSTYIYLDARGKAAQAPRARGDGSAVCRILADGWEVIPLSAGHCEFAIPAGDVVALDAERRIIGPAKTSTHNGFLNITPIPGAISYRAQARGAVRTP